MWSFRSGGLCAFNMSDSDYPLHPSSIRETKANAKISNMYVLWCMEFLIPALQKNNSPGRRSDHRLGKRVSIFDLPPRRKNVHTCTEYTGHVRRLFQAQARIPHDNSDHGCSLGDTVALYLHLTIAWIWFFRKRLWLTDGPWSFC